jgi:hypothetical protein
MTADILQEWLNTFNAEMKKENRNPILFIDNPTCHLKAHFQMWKSPGSHQMQ